MRYSDSDGFGGRTPDLHNTYVIGLGVNMFSNSTRRGIATIAALAGLSFGPKAVDAAVAEISGRDDLPKSQLPIMCALSTVAIGWAAYKTRKEVQASRKHPRTDNPT